MVLEFVKWLKPHSPLRRKTDRPAPQPRARHQERNVETACARRSADTMGPQFVWTSPRRRDTRISMTRAPHRSFSCRAHRTRCVARHRAHPRAGSQPRASASCDAVAGAGRSGPRAGTRRSRDGGGAGGTEGCRAASREGADGACTGGTGEAGGRAAGRRRDQRRRHPCTQLGRSPERVA